MAESPEILSNPFPGLRPFKSDEAYLFFGREKQTDELLRRLRINRFLSVVGSSGSGKSSLVRCGLIPSLYGGAMSRVGSNWRVATFRPGEDPINRLLDALTAPGILGASDKRPDFSRASIEAKLRRSALGLIDAVKLAQLPKDENVLVVVDQFEELFRFRQSRQVENPRDEAIAFVKLLLEASRQQELPIYVALTMRSDFIGDCMEYPGLAEAINAALYLVPQMSRDELRSAIAGPVAVAGGEIAQRLIQRLLNDVGIEPDQLPLLQHTLMRTWDHWRSHISAGQTMDIPDYEAVGTMRDALSRHADEAFEETGSDRNRLTTEKLFRALTDTFSDARGVRRPESIAKLVEICGATEGDIVHIVEIFRRTGRSFLMPPLDEVPILNSRSIIDISHESLMRRWVTLTKWADLESRAAGFYVRRLSPTAVGFLEGSAALWRNPDLAYALRWRQENEPTSAWAEQFNTLFAEVMEFLDRSECAEAERQAKERRRQRLTQVAAVAFAILFIISLGSFLWATRANARAEKNLRSAEGAVDRMLIAVNGKIGSSETPVVPGLEGIREQSMKNAADFYNSLDSWYTDNETVNNGKATSYLERAQVDLRSRNYPQASDECQRAIKAFGDLANQYASEPAYREQQANSYMMQGEVLRTTDTDPATAEKSYGRAISIFQQLLTSYPQSSLIPQYTQELARTFYNRGVFLSQQKRLDESKADFDSAINLLKQFRNDPKQTDAAWDLARAYNDRANLLSSENLSGPAKDDFMQATSLGDELLRKEGASPDYQLELAIYYDGLAGLLLASNLHDAKIAADKAQGLINGLAMPMPSVNLEMANIYTIRGAIIKDADPHGAAIQFQNSMAALEKAKKNANGFQQSNFNSRVADLAEEYMDLAEAMFKTNDTADARIAVREIRLLLPNVPEPGRTEISNRLVDLGKKLY